MARTRSLSAHEKPWSLVQVAQAADVSYQFARTANRLGFVDSTALRWHDVLVLRTVDALGGHPTSNRADGQMPDRVHARVARTRAAAQATRNALRQKYMSDVPAPDAIADMWLVVDDHETVAVDGADRLGATVVRATGVALVLPLSMWVAALAEHLGIPAVLPRQPASIPATAAALPPDRDRVQSTAPVTLTAPVELDETLYRAVAAAAQTMSRSPVQQMEHWARIGRRVEEDPGTSTTDVAALLEGRAHAAIR